MERFIGGHDLKRSHRILRVLCIASNRNPCHGDDWHLPPAAGKSNTHHIKIWISICGLCVRRTPVCHDNRCLSCQKICALSINRLADICLLGINISAVYHFLQKLKTGTHIVTVFLLPTVERLDFLLGIATIIQVCIGLCKHKCLKPPAVSADGCLKPIFLQNPAARQKLLGCLWQFQMILVKQVLVDKQTIRNDLLRNRHKLSIIHIRCFYHVPQILHTVKTRQIHQLSFCCQLLYRVWIEQI